MAQMLTTELFFVSLVVLLLVLLVILVLYWIIRQSKSRNLTELKVSAGRPPHILTIRTDPDHANQLLDRLLDRVFLQVEPGPADEFADKPGAEPGEDLEEEESTAASLPRRAVNAFHNKVWKRIIATNLSPVTPPPCPPTSPPAINQDHTDNLGPQQSDATQHASLSS